MRLIFIWTMVALGFAGCAIDGPGGQEITAITNVTLLDANQETEDVTVVFSEDGISAVGHSVHIPEGATVIDGRGKFLIPGLWDTHVHLSFFPNLDSDQSFPLFIANGITAVRDTGGLLDIVLPMREAARAPDAIAPRVYLSGPLVDGEQRVYAGQKGRPNLSVGVATPEEARAQVDSLHAAGVDLIKLYEMHTPESFAAAANRATELDLPITSHVPLSMDAVEAAKTGVDGIEHMRNLEQSCASDYESRLQARRDALDAGKLEDGGTLRSTLHARFRSDAIHLQDDARCAEVIATLARENVFITPTLIINIYGSTPLAAEEHWWGTYDSLPDDVQKEWRSESRSVADRVKNSTPSAAAKAFYNWNFDMVARLNAGGVKIMAGTDSPIGFLTPGYSLHEELALLVQAGLTPIEALTAATLHPAEFMRISDKTGTIEPEKWADMVLLDADPREDIRNTMHINMVIKAGRVFDRAALDQLLNGLDGD